MDQNAIPQPSPQPNAEGNPARRHGHRGRWGFKLALCLLCVPLLGVVVMLLWNWVMPPILPGVAEIGFWRALGLLVLCRILFGGFRGRHGGWRDKRRFMRARWEAMTPEERERCQLRSRMFCREERK
ncbi:hypothetical protein [Herbaspirillum rubrisubalbicans]|uniref:Uncharacterized protein n=1 Tax=Herbaspirillum rubrisubalbicans TaxID=80842 RepID=A0AAD0UBB0_9BURK|nr:hypothetical protein [Herbaspirillum rubrisubalbicans]AYR25287.1 hypothetical protein RC54_16290 [Herbaspirillum rubrisubalbicans]